MILQPLIENSIKHGLSRKIGEGRITVRSRRLGASAIIEIEDNGLGISDERLNRTMVSGIGLRNVNERLRVIYGANYSVKLRSEPGKGTCARIEIPELVVSERISA
jgi:sensor histidine kinase YesM